MTSSREPLGQAELELLRFVARPEGATGREAADEFAAPRGQARTTALTMLERLRRKGYLKRRNTALGVRYFVADDFSDVLQGLVGSFVDRVLGGSLAPFTAYLSERADPSPEELDELRRLVDQLERRTSKEGSP
jgi:predicted transcriptional regulator